MTTLIITEKPKVAERIANSIGSPKKNSKRGAPYYEVGDTIVAPVVGHVYSLTEKNPGKWEYPVFDIEWRPSYEVDKSSDFSKSYLQNVKELAKKCDHIINSCDYDIEGEVIGYNVIKFACNVNPSSDKVRRMKYSTLTKESISKAYGNLQKCDMNMAEAGLARHMLDWYWGINMSRALSLSLRGVGRYATLSVGRVQGPTLKFLAVTEKKIREFKPETYWQLELVLIKDSVLFSAFHIKDKFLDKDEALRIKEKCGKKAKIVDLKKSRIKQKPPTPFDLTTLQTEAYRCLKIDPRRTLQIAQDLYIEAYISYPRTASEQLPPDIDCRKIISSLKALASVRPLAESLLAKKSLKPNNGKKTDPAHPAIHPTGEIPTGLDGAHKDIYELIVHRFLATFGDDAVRESVTVEFDNNGEQFIAKGITTVVRGWHELYGRFLKLEEELLPQLAIGEELDVKDINLLEKETKPPKRYTPASIIRKMEKENIGTKATRANIVDILYKRGYVTGSTIEVTELGLRVVDTLNRFCPEVVNIKLTREFEERMDDIQNGKTDSEQIISEGKATIERISAEFKSHEKEIGKSLRDSILSAQKAKDTLGGCIKCDGNMVMRTSKNGQQFVGCDNYPNCTFTMSLPKGKIKKAGECKQCGYAVLQVSGRKPWRFCANPHCPTKKNATL